MVSAPAFFGDEDPRSQRRWWCKEVQDDGAGGGDGEVRPGADASLRAAVLGFDSRFGRGDPATCRCSQIDAVLALDHARRFHTAILSVMLH